MLSPDQLAALRREYRNAVLDERSIADDPLVQLERWLGEAIAANLPEPNAMVLATADEHGAPSARMMLLKGILDGELQFYTNLESRKGREIAVNPQVALLFYWPELERQVRIEGRARLLDRDTVAAYFATRPRAAQLGAWASRQSTPLESRAQLEDAFEQYAAQLLSSDSIPVPPWWGGYAVRPHAFEFWQGRENRLHDRIRYEWITTGWRRLQLAP